MEDKIECPWCGREITAEVKTSNPEHIEYTCPVCKSKWTEEKGEK